MSMQIDIDVKDIDVHLDADSLHGRLVSIATMATP